jgi:phage I-like protein
LLLFFLFTEVTMLEKTILALPTGQFTINGQITEYEDKYQFIIDNIKNPFIPNAQVIMNGGIIGRVKDYKVMGDGLYLTLELNNEIDISNKYPFCQLEDYINDDGVSYKFFLKSVILNDKPQYIGNVCKQLDKSLVDANKKEKILNNEQANRIVKELQVPNPNNYNSQEEWMKVCIPQVMNEGLDAEAAKGKCYGMWQNKATGQIVPDNSATPQEKKSKIEILNQIKKLIEKNGYAISDEKILEMFGVIQEGKGYLTKLNRKLDKNTHEIKVFPKKTVYIEKYDEYINFDDKLFGEMIDSFNCPKLFKPYIDEDHQLGEKYADIIDLYIKPDGLYAKVQLNEKGINAIKNNIYSYISPEWGDRTDTDGDLHKNVLWAITLTNIPALEGENPKLQDQIRNLSKKLYGGNRMDLRNKLSNLEGRVSNYKLQDEAPVMPPEIMEAIQMIKDAVAKIDELTQINQQQEEQMANIAAEKEVAEKLAEDYKTKFDTIEAQKKEAEKEAFFTDVVSNGQLEAGEVEDWKLQYDKSKDFVVKILTSKPKKELGTQKTTTSLSGKNEDEVIVNGKKIKLTQEDYDIMAAQKFDRYKPQDVERYVRDVYEGTEV